MKTTLSDRFQRSVRIARAVSQASRRASVLVVTILSIVVLGLIVGGYLTSVNVDYRHAHRQWHWLQALEAAESGLEIGISHVQAGDFAGWGGIPDLLEPATNPLDVTAVDGKAYGTVGITVSGLVSNSDYPVVQATGYVTTQPGTVVIKRTARVILAKQHAGAINAKKTVDFAGNDIMVDSYKESDGTYASQVDPITGYANDNGDVLAFSSGEAVINVGNSQVWGNTQTESGGTVDVGPLGSVSGEEWDGLIGNLSDVTLPAGFPALVNFPNNPNTITIDGAVTPKVSFNSVSIGGSVKTLIIKNKVQVYVGGGFSVFGTGQITVQADSNLVMYCGGNVAISGNAVVNETGSPKNVSLFGLNTSTSWSVNGNGTWSGMIYAPNADLTYNGGGMGGGDAYGVIGANSVKFNGTTKLHWEETMDIGAIMFEFPYRINSWQEILPPVDTP